MSFHIQGFAVLLSHNIHLVYSGLLRTSFRFENEAARLEEQN